MEVLEESNEELKNEVQGLKEQMAQMMEILKSLEKKNTEGTPSSKNEEQQVTPPHPPGLTSQGTVMPPMYTNNPALQHATNVQAQPWPMYGLPPGYTPPVAINHQDNVVPASVSNLPDTPQPQEHGSIATENPQTNPSIPVQIPQGHPLHHNISSETHPSLDHQNQNQPRPLHFNIPNNSSHATTTLVTPSFPHKPDNNAERLQSGNKLQILEERLRAIERGGYLGLEDASELCLVPDVIIPPKFKVPEFDKYKGMSCPKNHLTMYCRKMASYINDEKLLIHFFQDSLTGAASSWYTHLERSRIRCWKDLADAFLKQYKYNIDMAPDRMHLQSMSKKDTESFKEYAQRWREVAAQVEPPLMEKEMVAMFIDTLQSPFYDRMIGSVSSNFSDIVIIGERVESGMRTGKITYGSNGANNIKKPLTAPGKKKEGETHAISFDQRRYNQGKPNNVPTNSQYQFQTPYMPYPYVAATSQVPYSQPYYPTISFRPPPTAQPQFPISTPPRPNQPQNQNPNPNQRRPNTQERRIVQVDPIPVTYTQLLPDLIRNSLVVPCPMKPVQPPYPKGYDPNAKCDYHAGAIGHSTENCTALKYKVQDLINAKWLNFKEGGPNVGNNPLPGHENTSTNAVENDKEQHLIRSVEDVKTPMRIIFAELCKFGMVKKSVKRDEGCSFHIDARHNIEDCEEFKLFIQKLMDKQLLQIGCHANDKDIMMANGHTPPIPKPLVVYYTKSASTPGLGIPKPITIQMPESFPYKDNKAVPWQYNAKVYENIDDSSDNSVTNIAGIGGMTRSGRVYTPKEIHGEAMKDNKGKEKASETVEEKKEQRKEVTDEEAGEFLKFIKQSEYTVVDQLNRLPAKISILSLLLNSEPHRKLLLKILNEAHVSHNITPEKFEGVVGNIIASNYLTFTDDEIPAEGTGHNQALHISVKCQGYMLARVLVDNGSALNVMPKSTLSKLSIDGSHMKPSNMVVRAFDGSRREVMGEIELPIQIGPCTFQIAFQVMDILPAYSCLLGRPWLHSAGVVPSTLHQKLKFIVDNKLVIVTAENDVLVTKPSSTPYIEVAEEAVETSFQALEIVNAIYVKEGNPIVKPQLSKASKMVAKIMIKGGYQPGKGLGKDERGHANLIELHENKDKFGLGYKPTKEDWKRITTEKKEKRLARLENREPKIKGVPICDIHQSFQSAGLMFADQIAAVEDQIVEDDDDLVHPCPLNMELKNWEIVEFPVIFSNCENNLSDDDSASVSYHDFDHTIFQADEEEEEWETPSELLKLIEQETKEIKPHEEAIEVINLGTETDKKEVKIGTAATHVATDGDSTGDVRESSQI